MRLLSVAAATSFDPFRKALQAEAIQRVFDSAQMAPRGSKGFMYRVSVPDGASSITLRADVPTGGDPPDIVVFMRPGEPPRRSDLIQDQGAGFPGSDKVYVVDAPEASEYYFALASRNGFGTTVFYFEAVLPEPEYYVLTHDGRPVITRSGVPVAPRKAL